MRIDVVGFASAAPEDVAQALSELGDEIRKAVATNAFGDQVLTVPAGEIVFAGQQIEGYTSENPIPRVSVTYLVPLTGA